MAKAELEAAYKPSPRANYAAAIARARSAYAIAKQECDDQSGPAKKACVNDAKAALGNAKAEAKLAMLGSGKP